MKCPECGTEVADNVTVCPSCGYEIVQSETEAVEDTINTTATVPVYKNKKYIGIALCMVDGFTYEQAVYGVDQVGL